MDTENKYTPEMESKYIDELRKLTSEHPKQYKHILKMQKYADLLTFILYKTQLLADPFYKMSTKVYWVLNGLTDFPTCYQCGKPLKDRNTSIIGTYPKFCCCSCRGKSAEVNQARENTLAQRFGSLENYYKYKRHLVEKTIIDHYGSMENYNKVRRIKYKATLITRYGDDCYRDEWTEKSKKTCLERYGVDSYSKTPEFRDLSSKIWKHIWEDPEFRTRMSNLMKQQYGSYIEKIIQTNIKRYGSEFYFGSDYARHHRKNMIEYEGVMFDSKLEIQFYSYCIEHGLQVEVHPDICFTYVHEGKEHKYFPDFLINSSTVVETKGSHFFRTGVDGITEMFLPFRDDTWDDEEYESHCKIYNEKYKCMIANNVLLVTERDMSNLDEILLSRLNFPE